jgi:L-gulonolactone oxidase
LDISPLRYLLAIDYEGRQVVAGAGMSLGALRRKLAPLGYMLPNLSDGEKATIGGAIATASHGSGMAWGSLSDASTLAGMQLILANGTVLDLDAERTDDAEIMSAARTSLGGLGVISQVTLNVTPLNKLAYHARRLSREEALNSKLWKENDHYEISWIPHTDTYLGISRKTTTENTPRREALSRWWEKTAVDYHHLKGVLKSAGRDPTKTIEAMETLASRLQERRYVGRGDLVLRVQQQLRTVNSEFALPIGKAHAALQAVQDLTAEWVRKGDFVLNLPVRIRFTKGDEGSLLSPAGLRNTVYIEVASTHSLKHSIRFFRDFEFRMRTLGGRPHWGKLFFKNPARTYPDFARFVRIQNQLDPHGKFINPFMMHVLAGRDMTDLHAPSQ